jgi:(p)ppGpp synthase/HD superfamily hydrolase
MLQVQKAIAYAREAHTGQMRKTGEPYITHCVHTARILAALVPAHGKRAVNTVVAGVLHDVVDDTGRDLRDVREHFGDEVARLVAGVSKLSHINQVQSIPFGQGFVDGLSCSQCL